MDPTAMFPFYLYQPQMLVPQINGIVPPPPGPIIPDANAKKRRAPPPGTSGAPAYVCLTIINQIEKRQKKRHHPFPFEEQVLLILGTVLAPVKVFVISV